MSYCPQCHEETPDDPCTHCGAATVLDDTWVLEDFLGHGANGYTWRARHVETGEIVAIKELSFRKLTDLKQLELFEREAEALQAIEHPNVPQYRGQFVVEGERFVSAYLVQELIDGKPLDQLGRVDEDQVREWMLEIAESLDALHAMRPPVIHRDIKPSNIMRRTNGELVLIDFGSIRAAAQGSMGGSTVAGTMGYMAPEQLRGKAEPASDYYGLGATALALLAGRDAADLIDPHDPGGWRDEVEVSDRLGDVLQSLLAAKPGDRPRSADALRSALVPREPRPAPTHAVERIETRSAKASSEDEKGSKYPWRAALAWFGAALTLGLATTALVEPSVLQVFAATTLYKPHLLILTPMWLWVVAMIPTAMISSWGLPLIPENPWPLGSALAGIGCVVLMWSQHLPSEQHPKVEWLGERDGVVHRALVLSGQNGCALVRTGAKLNDVKGATRLPEFFGTGCPKVQVTPFGSMWVQMSKDHVTLRLYDLWTGELLWDDSKIAHDVYEVTKLVDEQALITLPDGSQQTVGLTREERFKDGSMSFASAKDWAYAADLPTVDGFDQQVFTRDGGCGALNYSRTTKIGPGEWQLAQVGPGFGRWQKTVRELTGAEALVGAFVGKDSCWIATEDVMRRLDPHTGKTTDTLEMTSSEE